MHTRPHARLLAIVAFACIAAIAVTACDPAPVVSNVSAIPQSPTSALVYWETDVASSSQVFYGLTTSYGSSTTLDTTGRTAHLQSITGLAPSTTYHYKVRSQTSTSNPGDSADGTFTTDAAGISTCQPIQSDEACWALNTGVLNTLTARPNDRWTENQILNDLPDDEGHYPAAQLGSWIGSPASPQTVTINTTTPYTNHRIWGCIRVTAINATVQNVYVNGSNPPAGGCHPGGAGTGSTDSGNAATINTGNDNASTAMQNFSLLDSEINAGAYSQNQGISGVGGNFQRVNAHGGYIIAGFINRAYFKDSYLHDVTRADEDCYPGGAVGSFPCTSHGQYFAVYLHKDVIWSQGGGNWSWVHVFAKHSDWTNPIGGSSGACLCDQNSHDVYIANSLVWGGSEFAFNFCASQPTQWVLDNVAVGGASGPFHCNPLNFPDYTAGSWSPSWNNTAPNTGGQGIPVINETHCTNIKNLSGSSVSCS